MSSSPPRSSSAPSAPPPPPPPQPPALPPRAVVGLTTLPPLPPTSSLSVPAASASGAPVLLFERYVLIRKLGSGSFGDIYLGQHAQSGELVAVKLEAQDMRWKQLCFESRLYALLQGKPGIPRMLHFGLVHPYYVLVMELLGPSLEEVFNRCQRRFSLQTVSRLALQLLQRVELFHCHSFLHRDLKPDNFLVSLHPHADPTIFIIDYGLAKKYRDMRTHQHCAYGENRDLTGTVRYSSINAHLGIEQSRRDDLESVGYMLLYFLRGSLPWQGMKAASKQDKYVRISLCKVSISCDELCAGQPPELCQYLTYVRRLHFDQQPDYEHLRGLFQQLLTRKGWTRDGAFDWTQPRGAVAHPQRSLCHLDLQQRPHSASQEVYTTLQPQQALHQHRHHQPQPQQMGEVEEGMSTMEVPV